MTDDELERHLRTHYRAIDPTVAPETLAQRVGDALDRRSRRPTLTAGARPAFAALMAAALIVAVGLGLRPGGFLSSTGGSPSPKFEASPSAASPRSSLPPASASASADVAGTFRGGLWAIHSGALLVSADTGATWRSRAIPLPGGNVPSAFVLDPDHAWSVTHGPGSTAPTGSLTDVLNLVVNRTVDSGATWHETAVPGNYPGTGQALAFVDAQHGFLLCSPTRFSGGVGTVLRTDDGGATWAVAGTADWLGSMVTASDASTLWAGAEQEAGPVIHPILDVSRDGGTTWNDARLPGLEGQSGGAQQWLAGPPVFTDAASGFVAVVSADGNANTIRTRLYRTINGGRSWSLAADLPVEASAGPAVLGDGTWLVPTDNPVGLLASADGGASWQPRATTGLADGGWMTWLGAAGESHAAALIPTGNSSEGPAALYLSDDAGFTWRPADMAR